jgi:hypothetical protein
MANQSKPFRRYPWYKIPEMEKFHELSNPNKSLKYTNRGAQMAL